MNHFTRALAASTTTLLALNAQAATVTHQVEAGDAFSQVSANWEVSPAGVAFFNASGSDVTGIGGATVASQRNARFKYTQLAVNDLRLASFTFEDTTGQLLNASFNGGAFIESFRDGFGLDGRALLENLHVDLENGKVFATIEGTGGFSIPYSTTRLALWQLENASGVVSASGHFEMSLPSLALTQEGFEALSTGLQLFEDQRVALSKVTSFGSITAVPEPATYMLTAIGLVACWAVSRRPRATY